MKPLGWQKKAFQNFRLYVVTDLHSENSAVLKTIEMAYRGGTDIVQLRSKMLGDAALIRLGKKIRMVATKYRKLFFVNDRVDLAIATGADGIHLGQDDMPVSLARKVSKSAGQKLWIGKSTHSLAQALAAVREGADYIGVGPVFLTPTKPRAIPVGLKFVRQACDKIQIPWVAIGGIDLYNVKDVIASGATRIAVVRAIFNAKDPGKAAQRFQNLIKG